MKQLCIVGGGIAGLAAGIYARQSGFDTTIFEQHTISGGNCTSWKINGYFFEGGMHWLTGSGKTTPLHAIWKETGALDDTIPIYNRDPFLVYDDGKTHIRLYRNIDKLKKHLLSISPSDKKAIDTLCRDIKKFNAFMLPITDIKGVKVKKKQQLSFSMLLKMMPALLSIKRLGSISVKEYLKMFNNPGIVSLLSNVIGDTDFSAMALASTLGSLASGDGGYPKGGSLAMAQRMTKKFISLGGKIEYSKKVTRIIVNNNVATGVAIGDDTRNFDAVLITQDTLSAIDKLFIPPLNEQWMQELRQNITPLNNTFISLGIESDLSDMPENLIIPVQPFSYDGNLISTLEINNYSAFEGYAPKGCTAVTLIILGDTYNYWQQAKAAGTYDQKKKELANLVIARLSDACPRLTDKIALIDVATPLTYERYCGTYRGSWMSIMKKNNKRQNNRFYKKQFNANCRPNLKGVKGSLFLPMPQYVASL